MKQRIYDSRAQSVVTFTPLQPGRVSLYVCGPTVQSAPHIGHLRSALSYDIMRRWFTCSGAEVTLIRNVTDIDDKILVNAATAKAAGSAESWWALAYRIENEFSSAYRALGIANPTYEPRATAYIGEMIALITTLLETGHAYRATDGSANVYFDTATWPAYGELTRQQRENMSAAADAPARGKRDPRDFALWKAARDDEPADAAWPTPWGAGRPGWHIECSAMAQRFLGDSFDIHGGGLDLRFPHHENELAQSQAAGHAFARYWVHNGLVNTGGQKMSKSLGNSLFARDLLARARPQELRYFLSSAHYRSVLDYSERSLAEAATAYQRIENFVNRASAALALTSPDTPHLAELHAALPAAFSAAMREDFALPQALAALHGEIRRGSAALAKNEMAQAAANYSAVDAMLHVLGLHPHDPVWAGGRASAPPSAAGSAADDKPQVETAASRASGAGPAALAARALESLVAEQIAARCAARAAGDFATGDEIRDRLAAAGIVLTDTPTETLWSLA